MKPKKILPKTIEGMRFVDYRKFFYKDLKLMKAEYPNPDQQTSFIMLAEWEYPDLPGKKLPLLVIGEMMGAWENYYKNVARKRKEKDFCFGKCNFGEKTDSGQIFALIPSHGRIKTKTETILQKVLFKKLGLTVSLSAKGELSDEGEVNMDGTSTESTTKEEATTAPVSSGPKVSKEKIQAVLKGQVDNLKETLTILKAKFKSVKSHVAYKMSMGKVTRKELGIMRELQESYNDFNETYASSHPKLQQKFSGTKTTLDKQNKAFAKLALAVKGRKKSIAQQLADEYFRRTADRIATPEEIEVMQKNLKEALDHYDVADSEGDEKKLFLKVIYMTAQHKGPTFETRHTDVLYEYMADE